MLEFVHLSGPDAGKDEQTRRKVRSQAMRDFRRRQRAENERSSSTPSPSNIRSKSRDPAASDRHSLARKGKDRVPSKRLRSSTGSGNSAARTTRKASIVSMSTALPSENSRDGSPATFSIDQQPAVEAASIPERLQYEYEIGSLFPSERPSSALSGVPAQINSESRDFFDSQDHIEKMFDYCRNYLIWLCPDIDTDVITEVLTAPRQDKSSRPTFLAALCLASIGHLDAVQSNRTVGDGALYKARVFREINERMQASESAISDETVACLACLLSFEMSNCSKESALHLRGLKSIINLKGGLSTFGESLSMMLECLDLIHALMFDTEPILAVPEPAGTISEQEGIGARVEAYVRISRLLLAEQDDFHRTEGNQIYKERLASLPELLASARDIIDGLDRKPTDVSPTTPDERAARRFRQALERTREMGLERDPAAPDAHYMARIVYLRMLLLYNVVVHRISPQHPSNQSVIDGMFDAARKINDDTWEAMPYMRLWIFLTGTVTSEDASKKSFFKAHLVRIVYQMGLPEWRRAKTFIIRFLSTMGLDKAILPSAAPTFEVSAPTPVRPISMTNALLSGAVLSRPQSQAQNPPSQHGSSRSASVPTLNPGFGSSSLAPSLFPPSFPPSQHPSPYPKSGDNSPTHMATLTQRPASGKEWDVQDIQSMPNVYDEQPWHLND